MEKEIVWQEKIDRYLLHQMSDVEKSDFEFELERDQGLEESVRLQRIILEEITDRASFNSMLQIGEKKLVLRLKVLRIVSVAAIFTGLLGFFIWQPTRTPNEIIFNSYAASIPISISIEKTEDPLRGIEYLIPGLTYRESEIAFEGVSFYHNDAFKMASEALESISDLQEKNLDLLLCLSISQLMSDQTEKAITNLEYLRSVSTYKSINNVKYYLSICYIQENKIIKARRLLWDLKKNKGKYSKKATDILRKIRWF